MRGNAVYVHFRVGNAVGIIAGEAKVAQEAEGAKEQEERVRLRQEGHGWIGLVKPLAHRQDTQLFVLSHMLERDL